MSPAIFFNVVMRKIFALILSLFSVVCGAQNQVIEIFPRQFTAIELKGNVMATITIADSAASTITLHGLTPKQVKWRVKAGTLFVDVPSGLLDKGYVKLAIVQPSISKIVTAGADIESLTTITGSSLAIESNGSINSVKVVVDVQNLNIIMAGQSDVAVKGRAVSSTLVSSLGSRIDCLNCISDTVKAQAIGNSEIYVAPTGLLSAKANTGGTIYYQGDAALQLKTHTWGAVVPIVGGKGGSSRFKATPTDTLTATPITIKATKIEPAQPAAPKAEIKQEPADTDKTAKPAAGKDKAEKPTEKAKAEKPVKQKKEASKPEKPAMPQDVGDFF